MVAHISFIGAWFNIIHIFRLNRAGDYIKWQTRISLITVDIRWKCHAQAVVLCLIIDDCFKLYTAAVFPKDHIGNNLCLSKLCASGLFVRCNAFWYTECLPDPDDPLAGIIFDNFQIHVPA